MKSQLIYWFRQLYISIDLLVKLKKLIMKLVVGSRIESCLNILILKHNNYIVNFKNNNI